ncbi:unnamed protein product [Gongylonema pulchrum]|uniref:Helitron_like_N domain-containing protein n=1 Tax=Gongylonema pulchrum TaxID=637853 RepID=A0A183E426_9BILA|nr:unnamed protein product [Gongylonema pulchrum]
MNCSRFKKVVDNESVTSDEALALPYAEKLRLIQSDPITCAHYFDYRCKEQTKFWNLAGGPFGGKSVTHSYHRVEFQQRGSTHIHQLLWLKGAPVFDALAGSNERKVCDFIDGIIGCLSVMSDVAQQESQNRPYYILFQYHRHERICRKHGSEGCRFGIPFYQMRETHILQPLLETVNVNDRHCLARQLQQIKAVMNQSENQDGQSLDEFLGLCKISAEEYLLAIRSELRRCEVFSQRSPSDIMINPFSPKILATIRSNIDLQYVLDPYACASYIIDYINKSDRGVSRTIEDIVKELRKGNNSLRQAVQSIGTAHYNTTELSVQEANYGILQIPMSQCSEKVIFTQTSLPDERLHTLDPASDDYFVHGIIEHYTERPAELEGMSLADFAACYNYYKTWPRAARQPAPAVDEDADSSDETDDAPHMNTTLN